MAIAVRGLEWLNHNANRAYPLLREATGLDVTGAFKIPTDFIVSFQLSVPTSVAQTPGGFYIKTISSYSGGYSLVIGYDGESVASVLISSSAHTKDSTYRLGGLGTYADAIGYVTIGSLDNINRQPPGSFTFDTEGAAIEVDCIRPNIRNVVALQVTNGSATSDRLYGDVKLIAGSNMRISVNNSTSPAEVTFSAISGEGLNEECVCAGPVDTGVAIKTINGIRPDANGNFVLQGDGCLEGIEGDGGIQLNDLCSAPCCGCEELEQITVAAETLRQQIETLSKFADTLENKTAALDAAMFASMLGDSGCSTC